MCFLEYYRTVSEPTCGVACSLEAAADLIACLRKKIFGSGPLYHPVGSAKSFTKVESDKAAALANRTKNMNTSEKNALTNKDYLSLADDLFDFAIGCLIARGAVDKGPAKTP
jgi:hypothetical protein